jgi:NitT/TauT family transport system permease protein
MARTTVIVDSGISFMPEPENRWKRAWGSAIATLHRARRWSWVDLLIGVGVMGLLYGILSLASQWTAPQQAAVKIDLSPWALPRYTFFSLSRGLVAYVISLAFTLVYGYWAAKDEIAARVLIPLLDILQSIPVLAFLPGLLLALGALFPRNNVGLELAAILMIFTGQAWNMTFSFYHSVRAVPADQQDAATVYRFNWWQRLRWVELPFSTMGLVWNSMMSMAGGWFFLMITESYKLGDKDFRLPGIGSYMSVAVEEGHTGAMLWAMLAMMLMIVGLDQLLWRPVVVWAQKFRVEEGGEQPIMSSWVLNWLRRSRIIGGVSSLLRRLRPKSLLPKRKAHTTFDPTTSGIPGRWISLAVFTLLLLVLGCGAWRLIFLLAQVPLPAWHETLIAAIATLARVLTSTALGTLWALPAGLAIGLTPKLSRVAQPVVQVAASFPAPMLFPLAIALMRLADISLGVGSILLMLLGTQWYILFNVIAGAMSIPADLRETARSYRLTLWQRVKVLYVPAVFPYLVTGWVTAAGGAWNASIVAEYVTFKGETLETRGLGSQISDATYHGDFPLLAASVLVMSVVVVVFNRSVWRQLYNLAEHRFSLNK